MHYISQNIFSLVAYILPLTANRLIALAVVDIITMIHLHMQKMQLQWIMTGQLSLSSLRSLSDLRRRYCVIKEQHCWVLLQMLIFTKKGKQFLAFSLHDRSDLREFPPSICPAWVHVLMMVQTFRRIVRERYRWTTTVDRRNCDWPVPSDNNYKLLLSFIDCAPLISSALSLRVTTPRF